MARPKQNEKQNKIYRSTIRYTEEEWQKVLKKVQATPYTIAEFTRRCVLGKKIVTPELHLLDERMFIISNELSKLAGWTKNFYNTSGGMDKDLTRKILSNIEKSTAKIFENLKEQDWKKI